MKKIMSFLLPDLVFQPRNFTGSLYTKFMFGFGKEPIRKCECGRKVKIIMEQDRMEVRCKCGVRMELSLGDLELLKIARDILIKRWNCNTSMENKP